LIFLDATFLLGLILEKDESHERAMELIPTIDKKQKITSNIMIVETLNLLRKRLKKDLISDVYNNILKTSNVFDEHRGIYDRAVEISQKYKGKIGYADCTTIAIMEEIGIYEIASFDEHFDNKEKIIRIC